jgi:transcriptional regulator
MGDKDDSPSWPDWRDPASYDYTRDLTREGWAWEFLRRNPNYRKSWRDQADPEATDRAKKGKARVAAPAVVSAAAAAWGLLSFRGSRLYCAACGDPLASRDIVGGASPHRAARV